VRDIPRQATVRAVTDSVLVYLDFPTFKRLMGPMEDLLKRNEEKYAQYWNSHDALAELEKK
jgi:cAMP-dependent protein kinase regulator